MSQIVKVLQPQVIDGRVRRAGELVRVPAGHTYKVAVVVDAATLAARDAAAAAEKDQLETVKEIDLTPPPVAVIVAPERGVIGKPVEFDGRESYGKIEIALWAWEFGDGTKDEGPVVEHAYKDAATYRVMLTVTDAYKHQGTAEHEIVIEKAVVTPK